MKYLAATFLMFTLACSSSVTRLDTLEEICGIELPTPNDVFVNEEMDGSALDGQRSIHIDVRFEGQQKKDLEDIIRTSYLYQEDGSSIDQAKLRRELDGKAQKGVWVKNEEGFIFLGIGPENNSAYAEYDSTAGVLHFLLVRV